MLYWNIACISLKKKKILNPCSLKSPSPFMVIYVDGKNSFAQAKRQSFFTSFFNSCIMSNWLGNSVACTFKLYSESHSFSVPPLLTTCSKYASNPNYYNSFLTRLSTSPWNSQLFFLSNSPQYISYTDHITSMVNRGSPFSSKST